MHILQPGSLLGCLVHMQIKFNFISPAQLFLVRCKQNMLKIPYHTVAAHNCCTVPASSQHVRLKDLRVVTGGGKKKKKSFVNNFLRRALLKTTQPSLQRTGNIHLISGEAPRSRRQPSQLSPAASLRGSAQGGPALTPSNSPP